MSTVLFIHANPKTKETSYSLAVADSFKQAYVMENPQDTIVELDLYKMNLQQIDEDVMNGFGKLSQQLPFSDLTPEEQSKIGRISALADQFVAADKYVFVTPLWNFSVPPVMKMYIDSIVQAGKTFKYTPTGPVGLLSGKKAIHIQSRGGIYTEGPMQEFEHGDKLIRQVLSFMGVEVLDSINIEGTALMPDQAEQIKERAITFALKQAKEFAA